jgi:hypothetical protein
MKKLSFIFFVLVLMNSGVFAQFKYKAPDFGNTYIKTADLLVEASVTGISYFQDTSIKKIDYDYYNYDENGVWFVKYELTIHKIFKGNCDNKVVLITPYYGEGKISVDGKEILLKGQWSHPEPGHGVSVPNNYSKNSTKIFILNKNKLTAGFPFVPNTYKFRVLGYGRTIYEFLGIGEMKYYGIRQGDSLYKFNEIEDLYNYLEGATKQKRKDITHKQFEIFSTYAKVEAYKEKHFADSMYSNTFNERLRTREINQLNKDSFIFNSSYLNKINRFKTKDIK